MRRFFTKSRRLGLRTRITLAFGFGALLLSALLASTTWGLTRENLLNQRDEAAVDRVLINAVAVSDKISPGADLEATLSGVARPEGATPLLRVNDEWHGPNLPLFGSDAVDERLLAQVEDGGAARMRYVVSDTPFLVVGVPISTSDQNALYFEGVALNELESTLEGLGISLLGAAAVTTLAGFAVGFWASGLTLRPLKDVGEAAEAIAGGHLETRLDTRDDPDLRPLTESFNRMATALEDRLERDERFASEVSHELRSPLMTLSASIEVLENSRDDLSERAQTALDLLSHDLERFQQLVEDLLEISRFDAGAIHLAKDEVLAAEMVTQAVREISGDRVPVEVAPEAESLIAEVDKRRMGQVLANLLDNAQKYGDGATSVQVTAKPGRLRIAIEDTGPGVPVEERTLIFDRFSRGSEGGNRGGDLGAGLGLALVQEHVSLHDGRVWAEDRPDGNSGARFVVELPVIDIEEAELAGGGSSPTDLAEAGPELDPGEAGQATSATESQDLVP